MNESVTITLERYNEYLFYKEKFELLEKTRVYLSEILNDENFDIEDYLHKKIYSIYAKLCKE